MGRFRSSDRLRFNVSDLGFGIKRRMTLDYDGNFRVYSLINSTRLWETKWQALDPCSVHGLCGKNGICIYSPQAKCWSPPGYVVSDPTDWNQGCKPTFNVSLFVTQPVKFVEIPAEEYYGFDRNYSESSSFEACREICLESAKCLAFTYKIEDGGKCYAKSALFNGYRRSDFNGTLYLKVPKSLSIPSEMMVDRGSRAICSSSKAIETVVGSFTSIYGDKKMVFRLRLRQEELVVAGGGATMITYLEARPTLRLPPSHSIHPFESTETVDVPKLLKKSIDGLH
ncbi:OLC1v1034936C1 [Oldenlandia corymbosa var. corymbosa]|uniref:non-specific serine/threonine protein kinase n=1 Tax=Oldenlandia corymbosa var. corymbosa TaxID=529605 RepID=A0AAV1CRR2_OLDCO|nr:OLC1v1034936C1 [Oldenlandia corymbosa var. corymbosa]